MSKDLGSWRRTRSAADASMLTDIRRRAIEAQNYAAQQFLKPLFSPPSTSTLASGTAAIFAGARANNPEYTGTTTSGGGGGGDVVNTVGSFGEFAVSFGSPLFGDIVSAAVDSSGNLYALVWWGDASNKTTINQYVTTAGGIVTQTAWGLLPVQSGNNIGIIKYTSAGVPVWATSVSGTSGAYPLDLKVDSGGNVYVFSYITGATVTFRNYTSGGGSGTDVVLSTAATAGPTDNNDPFLMKYSPAGVFQWCMTVTSTGATSETPSSSTTLAVDSAGNSYITFNTANNTPTLTFKSFSAISGGVVSFSTFGTDTLAQGYRAFLVKTNTNGTIQWVTRMTRQNIGTGSLFAFGVGTNSTGSRITLTAATGLSAGFGVQDFVSAGSPITYGTKQAIAAGQAGSEAYITGFGVSGNALWVARVNSTGNNSMAPVAMDGDGNSYVGGYYTNPTTVTSAGTIGGGTITVSSYGTLSFANGFNGCIVKYNPSGACLGATAMTLSTLNSTTVPALACDASGNVYAGYDCGSTVVNSVSINSFGGAVGDGTPISLSLYGNTESVKSSDALLIKYNPSLAVQWVARVETGSVGTGTENARTIAAHPTSNYVFFGGLFCNVSTAPLKIYSASGVSGNVIQYTQSATLSGNQTGAANIRQGFLVKYV